jgi:hypothetical protein
MSFLRAVGSVSNRLSLYERTSNVTMTVRHENTSIAALSIIAKNTFNKETTLFLRFCLNSQPKQSQQYRLKIAIAPMQCSSYTTVFDAPLFGASRPKNKMDGIAWRRKKQQPTQAKILAFPITGPCMMHQCVTACRGSPAAILPGMRLPKTRSVGARKKTVRWKNTTK